MFEPKRVSGDLLSRLADEEIKTWREDLTEDLSGCPKPLHGHYLFFNFIQGFDVEWDMD